MNNYDELDAALDDWYENLRNEDECSDNADRIPDGLTEREIEEIINGVHRDTSNHIESAMLDPVYGAMMELQNDLLMGM